jgi:hypothetical protein
MVGSILKDKNQFLGHKSNIECKTKRRRRREKLDSQPQQQKKTEKK